MASSITDTTANSVLDGTGIATLVTHISAHTADPGTTGTNEVTGGSYARLPVTWAAASARSKALSGTPYNFSIPAGTTVAFIGMWSALSGGTFRGTLDVTDESFTGAGTYQLTSGSISI